MSNKFALYQWYHEDESGWCVCDTELFLKELERNKKFRFRNDKKLICTFNTVEEAIKYCYDKYTEDDKQDIKDDILDCMYNYFYVRGHISETEKYIY